MNALAPLAKMGMLSPEMDLVLAGLLGFGFGFMLERAGFGNACRLAGQWFGRDWSVFRVMFSAIATSMLGILALNQLGLMSFDAIYLNSTYLWGALVGGLLMGVGFVLGGYCPGTSVVALSTGKLDAIFYILGMVAGGFFFFEAYGLFEDLTNAASLGRITLPELFGWNPWAVAALIVAVAIGGWQVANALEKRFNPESELHHKEAP